MDNIYYYPISSTSLAAIFSQACILPACLYPNRPCDIQSKHDEFILLTTNFGCAEADCCLQVFLTDKEIKSLIQVSNGFFYYNEALPISRVKKIYFSKEEQFTRTISNINLSTAFIPNHIIEHGSHTFADISSSNVTPPVDLVSSKDKVRESYDKYDRILGALALMRLAHEEGCNVSCHYIDTVSKFNKLIKSQKGTSIDDKFHKVFDEPIQFLKEKVDLNTLETEARKNNQTIKKNSITQVVDSSNLEKTAYLCYVLYNYGVGDESRRNKIDELILNNFSGLKSGYEESCALYYGFNRGYAVFNNQYKKDGKTEIVKFEMETLLDYYIIESVFEYSFYDTISAKFAFFEEWVPFITRKAKNGEYVILDTVICDKKKVALFSAAWWKGCLDFLDTKTNLVFLGIDFSEKIKELILEPLANIIKDEIAKEYEDKLNSLIERADFDKKTLESEIAKYKQENKELQNTLAKIKDSSKCSNSIVESSKSQEDNVSFIEKYEDTDDFGEKRKNLSYMTKSKLEEMAKSKGITVSSRDKKNDIIDKILAHDSNSEIKFP